MPPDDRDVAAMVGALFTLLANVDRARRERKAATNLALLQVIASGGPIRPSDIAARQHVHQSLATRQIRELEDAGHVAVAADPKDGRSYLVTLTPAGVDELERLTKIGLHRFAMFVDDWETEQVRDLARLLEKLQASMTALSAREQALSASERRSARRSMPDRRLKKS
jgi:DNA-binding MarR family transcriptional regulator